MSQELFAPPGISSGGRGGRRRRQHQEDTSSYSVSEDHHQQQQQQWQQPPPIENVTQQLRQQRIQQLRLQSTQYGQHYQFNNRFLPNNNQENFSNTSSSGSYINDRRQMRMQQNRPQQNANQQQRSRLYRVFNVGGIQQQQGQNQTQVQDNLDARNIPVRNQMQSTTQENMLSERSNLNRASVDNIMLGRRNANINQDDIMLDASRGPMMINREQEDEEAKNEVADEHFIFYNKFIEKVSSQASLDLLLMIFEISLLMIAILTLLYIRSKSDKTGLSLEIIPKWSIFIVISIYPFLKISWLTFVVVRGRKENKSLTRKYESIQLKQVHRDMAREFLTLLSNLLFLGGCFVNYLYSVGSIFLLLAFLSTFIWALVDLIRRKTFEACKFNMIGSLRAIFNVNVLVCVLLICGSAFKTDNLLFKGTTWEQLLSPFYFFMTECLLIAIVSFVVLVNSVIQICCHGGSGKSSRLLSNFEYKNALESNNNILTNPNALVRVSIWCLYLSVCGLLCLFLLLKNAGNQDHTQMSIIENKGELLILYFGGAFLLTLIFYTTLRDWITQFMVQADAVRLDQLFKENLEYESTQQIILDLKETIERARLEDEQQQRNQRNRNGNHTSSDQEEDEEEEGGPDKEYLDQVKALEKALQDPELQSERIPRYFLKISNAYYVSAFKYYNQELLKCKQTLKKTLLDEQPNKVDETKDDDQGKKIEKKLEQIFEIKPNKKYMKTPQRRMNTALDEDFYHECEASIALFQQTKEAAAAPVQAYSERLQYNLSGKQIRSPIKKPESKKSNVNKTITNLEVQKNNNNNMNQQDCMICLSQPSDSVITPCGHGGICFECCQQIIADVVKNEGNSSAAVQPPFYLVGENQVKIYNFRCPLCRNIGIRIFQLQEPAADQEARPNKYCQGKKRKDQRGELQSIIKAKQYIDLRLKGSSTQPLLLSLQPIPIYDKKTQILDETFGFGDDSEEMKESLAIDEQLDENQLDEMMGHQYAFFEHQEADNFQILRQINNEEELPKDEGNLEDFLHNMDDDLPTCKLEMDQIAFRRPPSPEKFEIAQVIQAEKEDMKKKNLPIDLAQAMEVSLPSDQVLFQEIEVDLGSGFKVTEPESRAKVLSLSFHIEEDTPSQQQQEQEDADGSVENDIDYHPNQNSDRESQNHVATIESIGLSVPI